MSDDTPVRARTAEEEAAIFQQDWIRAEREITRLRAENEKLLANLQVLADTVRVAKDAASYNRHKNEHCVSRSIWSALSDQEKYARKVLSDLRAAKAALGESYD